MAFGFMATVALTLNFTVLQPERFGVYVSLLANSAENGTLFDSSLSVSFSNQYRLNKEILKVEFRVPYQNQSVDVYLRHQDKHGAMRYLTRNSEDESVYLTKNREDATQFRISPYSSTDSDNIYYIKFKDSLMHVKLVQEEAFSEHSNIIFPKGTANENIYVGVLAELLIC